VKKDNDQAALNQLAAQSFLKSLHTQEATT